MSKLLIINGISYDVPSKKLEYAIDTQFNYFKFPPRIKSITVNDAIDLNDTLDEIDLISSHYTIGEDVGMPARPGSNIIVYRAGEYDTDISNAFVTDTIADPSYPYGYTMYSNTEDKRDRGGWLIPTKLDMSSVISGNPFIKTNTFIVTPEMIELGENIYFNIQVAIRISAAQRWAQIQESANPLEIITPGSMSEPFSFTRLAVPYQGSLDSDGNWASNAFFNGNFDNQVYTSTVFKGYNTNYIMSKYFISEPSVGLTHTMAVHNSILIELRVQNSADNESAIVNKRKLGALAGTFDPAPKMQSDLYSSISKTSDIKYKYMNIGFELEAEIEVLIKQIANLDSEYKLLNTTYINLLTFITDRSTLTQLAELDAIKTKLQTAETDLSLAETNLIQKQQQLKEKRLSILVPGTNPFYGPTYKAVQGGGPDFQYDVEKLHPVKTNNPIDVFNRDNMLYKIKYMIDIKTAKPYDEYYIETSAGSPLNLIYKDRSYWQIVPQSKLSTMI